MNLRLVIIIRIKMFIPFVNDIALTRSCQIKELPTNTIPVNIIHGIRTHSTIMEQTTPLSHRFICVKLTAI
jgi:hypothetical protein